MRYQYLFIPSALLGNAFAQAPTLSLQNNRVEQANFAPKLYFCSNTEWRNCIAPVTSSDSDRCITTDRMDDVKSIAIDLGLCCAFYTDRECSGQHLAEENRVRWYPGFKEMPDLFNERVNSYMCNNGTLSSDCPVPRRKPGETSSVVSESTTTPTGSYLTT
ncbi:hypothetical protein A1F99_092000 [Pyrenophora tritici-repentis]|nr:hypothetical protein A1F99_092000 [Pyrenophora tritici-repentis]